MKQFDVHCRYTSHMAYVDGDYQLQDWLYDNFPDGVYLSQLLLQSPTLDMHSERGDIIELIVERAGLEWPTLAHERWVNPVAWDAYMRGWLLDQCGYDATYYPAAPSPDFDHFLTWVRTTEELR